MRFAAVAGVCLLALPAWAGTTHVVIMEGVSYAPPALTVKRGDTIVWRNKDPFPHTVTAKGAFDSGSIAATREWKLEAGKAGVFPYLCTLHPTMKGTLTVE